MTEFGRGSPRAPVYALLVLGTVAAVVLLIFWGRLRPSRETTYRGMLVLREAIGTLTVCGSLEPLGVTDPSRVLSRIYGELSGRAGQSVYAEVRGFRGENRLDVTQLRRMELESRGCDEDLSGMDFRAFGNEPFWNMDVGSRRIILTRPGMATVTFPDARRTISDGNRLYAADTERGRVELVLAEQPCRDTMAGSYYSWTASAKVAAESFEGCAKEGRP